MMDVERTIEFLLEEAAKHDRQIDRLVAVVRHGVTRTNRLDDALRKLVETQAEERRKTEEQFRLSDERWDARTTKLDARMDKIDERMEKLDERVDKLVSAIGVIAIRLPAQS